MIFRMMVASFLSLFVAVPVFAQTGSPGIDQRQHRQQQRIHEGVRSGELTPREALKLEAEQAKIRAKERAMKADGKLTPRERGRLHRDLNRSSKHIRNQKHDAQKR